MKASFALSEEMRRWTSLRRRLASCFTLDFRGTLVEVSATSGRATGTLKRVYHHFVRTLEDITEPERDFLILIEEETTEAKALVARLGRDPRTFDGHLLMATWLSWGLRIANMPLLHYYASKLLRLRVAECWYPETVTLHAASMCAPAGGGLLLVGEAAAGKTTLTLRLLDDGFRYCADDTSCIRCSDLTCIPFPMPFVVRGDLATGVPRSPGLRQRPPDLSLLDEPRWLVERWDAIGMPFRPDALYFLAPDTGGLARDIRPMRQADAALLLLRNLVVPLGDDAEAFSSTLSNFDVACYLADSCRCLTVNTTNLDRAYSAILTDFCDHAQSSEELT